MRYTYECLIALIALSAFSGCGMGDAPRENGGDIFCEKKAVIGGMPTQNHPAVVYASGCTGTLVSPNVVVTAEHCITDRLIKIGSMVGFGDRVGQLEEIEVTDIRKHPAGADVAVLSLKENSSVKPIEIRHSDVTEGESLTIVGFGQPADEEFNIDQEKKSGITKISNIYWDIFVVGEINDTSQAKSCYGDSGGPYFDADNQLVGIVGNGTDDSCEDGQGIATRVDTVDDFIDDFIDEKNENLTKNNECEQ